MTTALTVMRDTFTANSTTGELLVDGLMFCFTLEPRADRSKGKPYCIPAGAYPVLLQMSERFGELTPHLQGVPDFTEIEIHPGNYPEDTEGCTLVGEVRGVDVVTSSRVTFGRLMQRLRQAESIAITYVGGPSE